MGPPATTVVVTAFLCVLWYVWINNRPRYRPCLRCGRRVKVGELECPHCGFDFCTIGT
jgi:hypothetical protein